MNDNIQEEILRKSYDIQIKNIIQKIMINILLCILFYFNKRKF